MHVILETDEAWSVMMLLVSQIIDRAGLSPDGRAKVRRWRTDRAVGTTEMDDLTEMMNEALGNIMDERTRRLIRRRGAYISTKDPLHYR